MPPGTRSSKATLANQAKEILFLAFVTLSLTTPSVVRGPFTWLPLIRVPGQMPGLLPTIQETPLNLGPLALLPGLALVAWALARAVERPALPWSWGRPGISLPLAGMTLLMVIGLKPTINRRTLLTLLALGLMWWGYLFVINERPRLTVPLSLIIVIQSAVAVGQFALQRELGLSWLGEPPLDPQLSGTCVLLARGQRWLRAYGLGGHPNLLGALLSVLLLTIIDDVAGARRWAQVWFTLVGSAGLLGLLTTFSRSAWLAFGLGILFWLVRRLRIVSRSDEQPGSFRLQQVSQLWRRWRRYTQFIIPMILGLAFLFSFHDLVASRFLRLETPIEARSIEDRQVDANLALQLIEQHPWTGVGVQNYLPAVRAIEPDSRAVHNVILLAAAELGLLGAALWLWLAVSGLTRPLAPGWVPWIAMLTVGLFDIALFPTNSWYAAVLFGLLAAHVSLPPRPRRQTP